jgi:hypothetical protein
LELAASGPIERAENTDDRKETMPKLPFFRLRMTTGPDTGGSLTPC